MFIKDILLAKDDTFGNVATPVKFPVNAAVIHEICLMPCDERPREDSKWFPALIDTGCSNHLSIGAAHLSGLAARDISEFEESPKKATVTHAGGEQSTVAMYEADLWLRSNIDNGLAIKVEIRFVYYPQSGPPYPLLGTRTLSDAHVQFMVDYGRLIFCLCAHEQVGSLLKRVNTKINGEHVAEAIRQQVQNRVELTKLSILSDHRGVGGILQLLCQPFHAGKRIAEIAVDEGFITKEDMGYLLMAGANTDRIGDILVKNTTLTSAEIETALAQRKTRIERIYT